MRGFHTAALVALVALTLCAGGAADNNTPLTRGASNIGTAPATPSLNITATTSPRAQEAQEPKAGSFVAPLPAGRNPTPVGADRPNARGNRYKNKRKPYKHDKPGKPDKPDMPHNPKPQSSCSDDFMDKPMPCTSDSQCLEAFPCKNAECVPAKKEKKHKKEKYKWWRSNDDDEKDHPEEYERHQSSDICVCTGNKVGPCTPAALFPNDCTSIRTDIGICEDGICTAEPRDMGCPCGTDLDDCISDAEDELCLYPDQKCKCDGYSVCVPNLLPDSTPCIDESLVLGDCEIALCIGQKCIGESAKIGSACYKEDMASCLNAGTCTIDQSGKPFCDPLQCVTCASGVICPTGSPDGECCLQANPYCNEMDACQNCHSAKICTLLDGSQQCCPSSDNTCLGNNNACAEPQTCSTNSECPTGGFCCNVPNNVESLCVDDIGDACFGGFGTCCFDQGNPDLLECKVGVNIPCPCRAYDGVQCPDGQVCCGSDSGLVCTIGTTCPDGLTPCAFACDVGNGATADGFCGKNNEKLSDACEESCGTCSTSSDKDGCNNANSNCGTVNPPDGLNPNTYCGRRQRSEQCILCSKDTGNSGGCKA